MSRNRYTPAEDNAILDFVEKNKDMLKVGGNKLWKKAECERVTLQSWQSIRASFNHWPLAIWAQRLPRKGAKWMPLRQHFLSVLAPAQVHAPPPPLLQPLPPQHTQSHQKSLSETLGLRQWSPSDSSLPSFHKPSHPHPGATTKTTGRRLLFITLTVSPHRHTHM